MANCPQCNTPYDPGAVFCDNCGASLAQLPYVPPQPPAYPPPPVVMPSATSTCTQCGVPAAPGAEFCDNCGAALSAVPYAIYPPENASSSAAPLPAEDLTYCPLCGAANRLGARFCDSCGSPIAQLSAPDPYPSPEQQPPLPGASPYDQVARMSSIAPDLWIDQAVAYSVVVPLRTEFRFAHEPVQFRSGQAAQHDLARQRFVGRERELRELIQRIVLSDGGAFLITGYRGVGKTSFVNRAIQDIKEHLPRLKDQLGALDIVDIYLNLARPVTAGELMHHIVRGLYNRLDEKRILPLLDPDVYEALVLAYRRTSLNMTRKSGQTTERSFGLSDLAVGLQAIGVSTKLSASTKRSRSESLDMSFLAYEDKAAEYDIVQLSNRLITGYQPHRRWHRLRRGKPDRIRLKIIFVFDELDKLEDFTAPNGRPVIDEILNALKNLFTMSGMSFVFVGGKDLQERWMEDIGKGDSVYESVFAFHKYLPAMWAEASAICDNLVDADSLPQTEVYRPSNTMTGQPVTASPATTSSTGPQRMPVFPYEYQEFKQYLAFKGRGIPRSILRTLNQYVRWDGQRPFIAFEKHDMRRIRFYAQLQAAIDNEQKVLWGDVREEIRGEWQDKRRLEVYYLVDWILQRGDRAFTMQEAVAAARRLSTKIAPSEESAEGVVRTIIDSLLRHNYLETVQPSADRVLVGNPAAANEVRYCMPKWRIVEIGSLQDERDPEWAAPPSSQPPRLERYNILNLIGTGGMSEVYRAWDTRISHEVAIKFLKDHGGEFGRWFEQEARLLTTLRHPNLVRAYDTGEYEGRPYMVMDYINGPNLEVIRAQKIRLDLDTTLSILTPVLSAVSYLHSQQVSRCDLKPGNVLLDRSGQVYLIDLGIARWESAAGSSTMTGAVIGTPRYMAPEQVQGERSDNRADIYSLGVILYEMLTGRPLFEGDTPFAIMFKHIQELPLLPRQIVPDIPEAVEAVILKCLQKDPQERFQTVAELSAALPAYQTINLADFATTIVDQQNQQSQRDRIATQDFVPYPMSPDAVGSSTEVSAASVVKPALPSLSAETARSDEPHLFFDQTPDRTAYPVGPGRRITLGRNTDNAIMIDDVAASRFHAVVECSESGQYRLQDLNTLNGTFVNDVRISEAVIKPGDRIRIGATVIHFDYLPVESGSMVSASAPAEAGGVMPHEQ
jgi:serine/threonine protein kinase